MAENKIRKQIAAALVLTILSSTIPLYALAAGEDLPQAPVETVISQPNAGAAAAPAETAPATEEPAGPEIQLPSGSEASEPAVQTAPPDGALITVEDRVQEAEKSAIQEEAEEKAAEAETVTLASGMETTPEGEPTRDENGYITSTYGYPLKGDPYAGDGIEILSYNGANLYNLSASIPYTRQQIVSSGRSRFYTMSDKTFFGEWDAVGEKWKISGKLDYDNYPGLADVESSVKKGDYESAKMAYYTYYLLRERNGYRIKDTSTAAKDIITADLLCKNYMYNANSGMTPLLLAYVDGTPKELECDVTETVDKYKGIRQELTFLITATDKDGGLAEFASKEAGANGPTLTVNVNGTSIEIPALADTYITAGGDSGKKHGTEEILLARESAVNESKLVNSQTARTYIKFDVSNLKSSDTVTGAALNLYGSNSASDKKKEFVVFYSDDSNWEEGNKTWSNTSASTIFSYDQLESWSWTGPGTRQSDWGSRYMEELLRFNTWIDKLVKVYNATGDEKYAYTALRQLMDFLNVTGMHGRYLKDLDIAVRAQVLPHYIMQLLESEYMTPDIFAGLMKYMWIEGNEFLEFCTTGSNWGSSERMGHYAVALNFQEFKDVGRWFSDLKTKYAKIMDWILQDDGSSYELALGYTDYTLDTFLGSIKMWETTGIKGENPFTPEVERGIQTLAQYMMYCSMPGFIDNQEGDGYSFRSGYIPKRLYYVGDKFGDPYLLFGGTDRAEGDTPPVTSVCYNGEGKKVIMRTDWSNKANYLYSSVEGGVGNHAHQDDNNLIVSAYGQYLLVDPLYGSYSGGDSVNWLKSAKGHNVVEVNGGGQTTGSARGTIPRWETNTAYDFAEMRSAATRNASNYTRKVLFVKPGFWLVSDYLVPTSGANTNTYSQYWHYLPEADTSMDPETKTSVVNTNGVNLLVAPVAPEKFTQAVIKDDGWFSEGQGSFSRSDYTVYETKTDGNCVMDTILYPSEIGQEKDIVTEPMTVAGLEENTYSAYEFYVTDKKSKDTQRYQYFVRHSGGVQTGAVGSHATDASMLFAELDKNGNTISVIAQDASYVKNMESGQTIFHSDTAVKEISIDWDGEYCSLNGSQLSTEVLTKNNFYFYNQGKNFKKVSVNDSEVKPSATAHYLYFGGKPDDSGAVEPTSAPTPTKKPVHGGGVSGGGGGGPSVSSTPKPSTEPSAEPTDRPGESSKPELTSGMKQELEGHWAKAEIESLYDRGIVHGVSEDSLGLNQEVTRAEFITLMVRALDVEPAEYKGSFADVRSGDWYADYLQAAYDKGLLNGVDGNALPEAAITREEMAKILSAAAETAGLDMGQSNLDQFQDADQISGWAAEGIEKAVSSGLMNGMPDGTFAPKQNTKRDEAFVVVYRLLEKKK